MDGIILMSILGVVGGLYLLWWAGDCVVYYALAMSHLFNLSSFFVGFVILAVAADIPELSVAIVSALQGVGEVSAGDIVGANITDVALVLGITIFCAGSMGIHAQDRKKFLYLLLGVSMLMSVLFLIGTLTRLHGLFLIVTYVIFMIWGWRKRDIQEHVSEYTLQVIRDCNLSKIGLLARLAASFVLVFCSSLLVVHSAVSIALQFNLSLETVGATILAMGTSLPELVLSLSALRRKEYGLALGPTLGTVLCQGTLILGTLAVLSDKPINLVPLRGALIFMFVSFFIITYSLVKERINRMTGFALLSLFIGYLAYHFVPLSFNFNGFLF